jgi:hypothetical protein
MFCAPRLIFDGIDGVGSHFLVLRFQTHFQRYRGRRVPFSCFAWSDSFSAVPKASSLVFMFCAPIIIFGGEKGVGSCFSFFALPDLFLVVPGASDRVFLFCAPWLDFNGTEGVGSRFHVLRFRARFRRYRGHRVLFSCFARSESFSAVPGASGPVFLFCAPRLIFGGTSGVGSRFHVLRFRTRFRRYKGCWVPFSCFAHP